LHLVDRLRGRREHSGDDQDKRLRHAIMIAILRAS
jgi:hypothetical protein